MLEKYRTASEEPEWGHPDHRQPTAGFPTAIALKRLEGHPEKRLLMTLCRWLCEAQTNRRLSRLQVQAEWDTNGHETA